MPPTAATGARQRPWPLLRAILTVCAAASLITATTAEPALAACSSLGHVYTDNGSRMKWETDPIEGEYFPTPPHFGTIFHIRLGGNGLRKDTIPYWDVYANDDIYVGRLNGSKTGDNCVSNERVYPFYGGPGTTYRVKATYHTGNSNSTISGQNHFIVRFV
jgi:hypothetical protein